MQRVSKNNCAKKEKIVVKSGQETYLNTLDMMARHPYAFIYICRVCLLVIKSILLVYYLQKKIVFHKIWMHAFIRNRQRGKNGRFRITCSLKIKIGPLKIFCSCPFQSTDLLSIVVIIDKFLNKTQKRGGELFITFSIPPALV